MSSKRERVYHPLLELTLARLVEFVRNPGAVFWVFGFPVLLAVVLGIAFRDREPELSPVAATIAAKRAEDQGGRYIDFLLPGLIGLNVMGSSMWGIGYNVVDNRKRKLLKRFAATPMNRSHFLLAFMLSRMVFLVLEIVALIVFGWLIFDVHVYGSYLAVGVISVLGALTFAGLAILVAARTDSTEVGAGWMNFIMLPMWVVSGAFFSYDRFPEFLHPVIRALPLTSVNDALRMVMNHGESITAAWMEIVVLALWGTVSFVLALRIFRWQ